MAEVEEGLISVEDLVFEKEDGITASDVWEVIADISNYPAWNEFVIGVTNHTSKESTIPNEGDKITLRVMLGGTEQTSDEVVAYVKENEAISWRYDGAIPTFMLKSERWQRIHTDDNTGCVKLQSYIAFDGALKGVVLWSEKENIERGFATQQACVKREVLKRKGGSKGSVLGKAEYEYTGQNSEGNRFIKNQDL